MVASPLPSLEQVQLDIHEPDVLRAYNVILDFERSVKTPTDTMHARVLGFLTIHAPSIQARHAIVREIDSCGHDFVSLSLLGLHFIFYLIRPCEWTTRITQRNKLICSFQSKNIKDVNQFPRSVSFIR